jgi:hypothetical protein
MYTQPTSSTAPLRKVDLVQQQLLEPVGHGVVPAGHERGPDAPRHLAQAQVEAGRLHLVCVKWRIGNDMALLHHLSYDVGGRYTACRRMCHRSSLRLHVLLFQPD